MRTHLSLCIFSCITLSETLMCMPDTVWSLHIICKRLKLIAEKVAGDGTPVGAGKVGIWDSATGHCAHMLEGPGGAIEWLRWHPKGDVILAGSDDFTAWLWNAQTGTCMQVGNAWCLLHVPDSVHQKASS